MEPRSRHSLVMDVGLKDPTTAPGSRAIVSVTGSMNPIVDLPDLYMYLRM